VKAFCPASAAIELAMLLTQLLLLIHQMNCTNFHTEFLHCVDLHRGKIDFGASVTASIRLVHTPYKVSRRISHWTQNLDP
jgi:hypothetical protein